AGGEAAAAPEAERPHGQGVRLDDAPRGRQGRERGGAVDGVAAVLERAEVEEQALHAQGADVERLDLGAQLEPRRRQQRRAAARVRRRGDAVPRSEEHTSELQSREKLVCRLLLEKKNR